MVPQVLAAVHAGGAACIHTCVPQVCKNCGTKATPFWRKDKNDGRPLCNACGLYYSKNDAMRPKLLWKEDGTMVRACMLGRGGEGERGCGQWHTH